MTTVLKIGAQTDVEGLLAVGSAPGPIQLDADGKGLQNEGLKPQTDARRVSDVIEALPERLIAAVPQDPVVREDGTIYVFEQEVGKEKPDMVIEVQYQGKPELQVCDDE